MSGVRSVIDETLDFGGRRLALQAAATPLRGVRSEPGAVALPSVVVARTSARGYKRTDRLNELLREVVAEELERIGDDDPRLKLVTITGVSTVSDLAEATVYYATLGDEAAVKAGLAAQRHRLQKAVAAQVRARRTPVMTFKADPGILAGRQVDALLRDHPARRDEVPFDPMLYRDLGDAETPGNFRETVSPSAPILPTEPEHDGEDG